MLLSSPEITSWPVFLPRLGDIKKQNRAVSPNFSMYVSTDKQKKKSTQLLSAVTSKCAAMSPYIPQSVRYVALHSGQGLVEVAGWICSCSRLTTARYVFPPTFVITRHTIDMSFFCPFFFFFALSETVDYEIIIAFVDERRWSSLLDCGKEARWAPTSSSWMAVGNTSCFLQV